MIVIKQLRFWWERFVWRRTVAKLIREHDKRVGMFGNKSMDLHMYYVYTKTSRELTTLFEAGLSPQSAAKAYLLS